VVRPNGGTFLESAVIDSTNLRNAVSLKQVPIGQGKGSGYGHVSNSSGDVTEKRKRKASGEEAPAAVVDMSTLNASSAAVLFSDGLIRIYETNTKALAQSLAAWKAMHGPESPEEGWSLARLEVDANSAGNGNGKGGPNENHIRVIPIDKVCSLAVYVRRHVREKYHLLPALTLPPPSSFLPHTHTGWQIHRPPCGRPSWQAKNQFGRSETRERGPQKRAACGGKYMGRRYGWQ
jgi:hypothetical protein